MRHTEGADEAYAERAALYALGTLTQMEARAFEEHLAEGCEPCAAELRGFSETVALLPCAVEACEPPAGAREKLLARLTAREPRPAADGGGATATASDSSPAEARAEAPATSGMLIVRAGEGEWRETPDAGVFVKILFVDRERDTVTSLVRMEAGARLPAHRHRGVEQCLVLEGDLRAGGQSLSAGDYNCALPHSIHEELQTDAGALFLIVAPESYEVLEHGAGRQLPQP